MKLDKDQQLVVENNAQNILVVAGAGSGKTRVLTERVKYLLDSGVEPHNIVAITFTNMAADEIKERLKDVPTIGDAFIGTIHAFANKIYKVSGNYYEIMNEKSEQLIYEEILGMSKYEGQFTMKRFLQYMEMKKQVTYGRLSEAALADFLAAPEKHVLFTCTDDFKRILKRDNIITFDELLDFATGYFKSLNARVEHLLVDELQDIDTAQYEFIRALDAEHYFFVGDDWQAIYGWKGGNVNIFKELVNNSAYHVCYLSRNYRNAKEIVQLGTRIIRQTDSYIDKDAVICNKRAGKITVQTKDSSSRIVNLLKDDEDNLRDWFILTRTNKEAFELTDLLDEHGLGYSFLKKSDLTLAELKEVMSSNVVKIMTVHSAKGLESKKVILFGNFPLQIPTYRKQDEERRLMYVGVTRAEQELHIFN